VIDVYAIGGPGLAWSLGNKWRHWMVILPDSDDLLGQWVAWRRSFPDAYVILDPPIWERKEWSVLRWKRAVELLNPNGVVVPDGIRDGVPFVMWDLLEYLLERPWIELYLPLHMELAQEYQRLPKDTLASIVGGIPLPGLGGRDATVAEWKEVLPEIGRYHQLGMPRSGEVLVGVQSVDTAKPVTAAIWGMSWSEYVTAEVKPKRPPFLFEWIPATPLEQQLVLRNLHDAQRYAEDASKARPRRGRPPSRVAQRK